MVACVSCRDVIRLFEYPKVCRCGACSGRFLSDSLHAEYRGPGYVIGMFNGDMDEVAKPVGMIIKGYLLSDAVKEAGYWPIRAWRIPEGDRIIRLDQTAGKVLIPCSRCKPRCAYREKRHRA